MEDKINLMIFTGVAGAIQKDLKQWDIIIPNNLVQHDMDARPILEKFVIPCLKEKYIKANNKLVDHVVNMVEKEKNNNLLNGFGNLLMTVMLKEEHVFYNLLLVQGDYQHKVSKL